MIGRSHVNRGDESTARSLIDDMTMDPTIKDFEAAIAELEGIVRKLEDGDLPLEASLQLYERGVHLSRFCHAQLEQAERRIEVLNERGELRPAPPSLGAETPDDSRGRR
jgi:exodeoxyribonuclease VII small subunit